MLRAITKLPGIVWLSFPVVAFGAFFFQAEATFPVLLEEIRYRDDTTGASGFDAVLADGTGWVSQKAKPFRGTRVPVRIWARFEIPAEPVARRVLIRTGPWESAEYFFVRDGIVRAGPALTLLRERAFT